MDHSQHEGHTVSQTLADSATREGSGTSWLPDDSPMHAVHTRAGRWTLMGHGSLFVQYLHDTGDRGQRQAGSINWMMGMAERPLGKGRLRLRGMVSLEPWTIGGCGYPDLLATGETCKGEAIHDRQHPHDLFMEIAADYRRSIGRGLHLQMYGGAVGEPALGPVAFMHRISGLPNPLAPITHHWFDSTHITYGVMTVGVYGERWKAEGSVFNGREPDERRTDFDFSTMSSWSGRLWWLPTSRWALQVSGGRLDDAEPGHDNGAPIDIDRVTASMTYHRPAGTTGQWAHTVGWGRNDERGGDASHALLVESRVTFSERDTWYGRLEWARKSGHDLAVNEDATFGVAKIQGGYTRQFPAWNKLIPGVGATATLGLVPGTLNATYGRSVNPGFGIYFTLRPAAMGM